MATLTIRNIDEELKAGLRLRAALHGRSMEEEMRSILRQAVQRPVENKGLGQRLAARFQTVATELELPARSQASEAPDWDE